MKRWPLWRKRPSETEGIRRGGLPLRWRFAVLTAFSIALLSIIAVLTAYFAVRESFLDDLKTALKQDATKLADLYSGRTEALQFSPETSNGTLIIQIYDLNGLLLAASDSVYELGENALPQAVVLSAIEGSKDWQGKLNGEDVIAAMAIFNRGVVAVINNTEFIETSLARIAKRLLLTALILIALSSLAGYLVTVTAMRPISNLAILAERLGPDNLEPIHYTGPRDEVGQLTHVLNDLLKRLGVSMNAQKTFLAETSHELRTPLTSLQGFLERASRKAPPSVKRDLEDARRISQSMSRLVADLLQLSRGELVREMVPHLIDPLEDILAPIAEEYPGVSLKGELDETIVGDPERLRQLIRNLVSNAIRITEDPTKVELSFYYEGNFAILEVRDHGPGIPKDLQARIFDKFYKGPGGGAGLGLAIAKQIAEAHNGTLVLDSKVTNGASFKLKLPIMEEPDDEHLVAW
ncbi:MAG: HAMP domain-containing histidine kinase [Trueperaceae bacterium]|nr:HAMP domain-containing histidine kinase [Trueperaceae bacterium]